MAENINDLRSKSWRVMNLYKIKTKSSGLKTFKRNWAQRMLARKRNEKKKSGKPVRELILKSRQHGITTDACIESLDMALFRTNKTVAIIADKMQNVQRIFRKIKLAYDKIPHKITLNDGTTWVKPGPLSDNKNELSFEETGSIIYVDIKVRGDTINRLHVSEGAFVPDAEERIGASMEAVPKDGEIIIETTANGTGGYFFSLWADSVDGNNEFDPIFIGWNKDEENRLEVPSDFALTSQEKEIKDRYSLDMEQMVWRRQKKSRLKGLFEQEHPIAAEEAFLYSGRPKFSREKIMDWVVKKPLEKRMGDRLKIWKSPEKGKYYVLGVDVAEGKKVENVETSGPEGGSDWSVIEVFDYASCIQVAEWRGKIPYAQLPEVVKKIGALYNWAFVTPEKNNHGQYVVPKLVEIYPNHLLYQRREQADKIGRKMKKEYGWVTSSKTKPVMINELEDFIDNQDIKIFSEQLQKECLRYIIEDDGGTNAQDGYHDDTVIATALALQGRKVWNPLKEDHNLKRRSLGF